MNGTEASEHAARLLREIEALRASALAVEAEYADQVALVHENHREGARNLLHYLALRSSDLRDLQEALAPLGLSSLGGTEAHTLASLDAVCGLLRSLLGEPAGTARDAVGFEQVKQLADANTEALLGCHPSERPDPIMVTLPSEVADDPALARDLVEAGMALARINCAHDDAASWRRMVTNVRSAAQALGRPCRIEMELAGPKLRTGLLEPGPRIVRWRPVRDLRGRVTHAARIWIAPPDAPPPEDAPLSAWLPIDDAGWLEGVQPGDVIRLQDARGKKRKLQVTDRVGPGRWAECRRTAYVETGTELHLKGKQRPSTTVGELPSREQVLLLRPGDRLLLCADATPGRAACQDAKGALQPARIPISLPEVLPRLRAGEAVKFDDGRIEAEVVAEGAEEVELRITRARADGSRLRADKGINFPATDLGLAGLTAKDRADLEAVVELADVVGMSFVNTPADALQLIDALDAHDAEHLGVLLKIETHTAFEQLPWLLLTAMRRPAAGIMIARGDLAVEVGWERMAEVQEEILWFCEAAHVPVVWATQVLESLAKQGIPSRAEITDAAMAVRAECVMLNKGPHILETIRTLDDILARMREHQHKRTPRLRSLEFAAGRLERPGFVAPRS